MSSSGAENPSVYCVCQLHLAVGHFLVSQNFLLGIHLKWVLFLLFRRNPLQPELSPFTVVLHQFLPYTLTLSFFILISQLTVFLTMRLVQIQLLQQARGFKFSWENSVSSQSYSKDRLSCVGGGDEGGRFFRTLELRLCGPPRVPLRRRSPCQSFPPTQPYLRTPGTPNSQDYRRAGSCSSCLARLPLSFVCLKIFLSWALHIIYTYYSFLGHTHKCLCTYVHTRSHIQKDHHRYTYLIQYLQTVPLCEYIL